MEFWVKLIEVRNTTDGEARGDLQANCTHVLNNLWLFEGDEDALHEGVDFAIIDEQAIEGHGDLHSDDLLMMVLETFDVAIP